MFATNYPQPTNYYLVPTGYCQLLTTCCLLPAYLLPSSYHFDLTPATFYLRLTTYCLLRTRFYLPPRPSTFCLSYHTLYVLLGTSAISNAPSNFVPLTCNSYLPPSKSYLGPSGFYLLSPTYCLHLQPSTFTLLPSYCLLPLPSTSYILPSTSQLLLSTLCHRPTTSTIDLIQSTVHLLLSTFYLLPSTSCHQHFYLRLTTYYLSASTYYIRLTFYSLLAPTLYLFYLLPSTYY